MSPMNLSLSLGLGSAALGGRGPLFGDDQVVLRQDDSTAAAPVVGNNAITVAADEWTATNGTVSAIGSSIELAGNGSNDPFALSNTFAVTAGDKWMISARIVSAGGSPQNSVYIRIRKQGTFLDAVGIVVSTTETGSFSEIVTIPSGWTTAEIAVQRGGANIPSSTTLVVADIRARPILSGALASDIAWRPVPAVRFGQTGSGSITRTGGDREAAHFTFDGGRYWTAPVSGVLGRLHFRAGVELTGTAGTILRLKDSSGTDRVRLSYTSTTVDLRILNSAGLATDFVGKTKPASGKFVVAITVTPANGIMRLTMQEGDGTVITGQDGISADFSAPISRVDLGIFEGDLYPIVIDAVTDYTGSEQDARVFQNAPWYSDWTGDMQVVLLAGQSNMRGTYGPISATLDAPDPQVLQWNHGTSTVSVAEDPLPHEQTPPADSVGPGVSYGKDLAASLSGNDRVLLVPAARGSTGFSDGWWVATSGNGYKRAVARADAAMAANSRTALHSVCWVQGEHDAIEGMSQATYASNLDAMIAAMRSNVTGASSTTPFVIGDLVPDFIANEAGAADIVAALADTPSRVTAAYFADSTGLTDGGDNLHFDAASARALGSRMFATLP